MPTYKLTYFNGRGRAEIIRLIFAVADVEYEDHRIDRCQWKDLKPGAPFGQVPILEVDEVKLCQSEACARYIAKKFNLAGATELEQAQVDMIVDCLQDTNKPVMTFRHEKDEEKKAEGKKKYKEEQLPGFLSLLENLLKTNKDGDGYFVGEGLTWADLKFLHSSSIWSSQADQHLDKFPKLLALRERLENLPKIAAWLAKRPQTEF